MYGVVMVTLELDTCTPKVLTDIVTFHELDTCTPKVLTDIVTFHVHYRMYCSNSF